VPTELGQLPPKTPESIALSKSLLGLGFRFVGPTTVYAAMQSLGVVNDHLHGCWVRGSCSRDRRAAEIPSSTDGWTSTSQRR
jgi:DNA-3-methyladenine glycosylase I